MSKSSSLTALAMFAALAACAGTPPGVKIITNPPAATVFINGELAQDGTAKSHVFDFTSSPRACVQVIASGYIPWIDYWSQRDIQSMLKSGGEQTITLTRR